MKQETTDQIKVSLEYLSNLCLENSGVYRKYTDEDLANAVHILQEIFMAKIYDFHVGNLNQEKLENLAEEAGKVIRQMILDFTGVDLHEVYSAPTPLAPDMMKDNPHKDAVYIETCYFGFLVIFFVEIYSFHATLHVTFV